LRPTAWVKQLEGTGEIRMKAIAVAIAIPILVSTSWAQNGPAKQERNSKTMQPSDVLNVEGTNLVAPALEKYAHGPIAELWNRPGLSRRDRSMITLAALIARNQTMEMAQYMNLALDSGLKPREISEMITHLAFYSGWSNAMSAVAVAKDVFAAHHIGADQLAAASPTLLPLNKEAEEKRATSVEEQYGKVAPGVVQYTTNVLFLDLWLRPGLAPRDRSLVTVTALIANGQAAQVAYHLNRAIDNGLTHTEAAETITHLAFYVGWPNVFSALPVAKDVFEKRAR
jgi:4-carboxymuconolactone decarboxylase